MKISNEEIKLKFKEVERISLKIVILSCLLSFNKTCFKNSLLPGIQICIHIYLRALSTLRGLRGAPEVPPLCRETQSLGQQMLSFLSDNSIDVSKTLLEIYHVQIIIYSLIYSITLYGFYSPIFIQCEKYRFSHIFLKIMSI